MGFRLSSTKDLAIPVHPDLIEMIPIDRLRGYDRNARTHSKKQIRQLADAIRRFGFTNPILVDDAGMILAGHGRVEAAKLLGMADLPCRRLSGMTEAEKRAYILADNKLALNAGWDEDLLAGEIKFILEDPELDISLTGFSVAEIDMLVDTAETGQSPGDDRDDVLPVPVLGFVVTRLGDVWQLGSHRLVCGDARDDDTYRKLMRGLSHDWEKAQLIFTDPPYNVPVGGHVTSSKTISHREFVMASGEMSSAEFVQFLRTTCQRLCEWSIDGSIHFICMDWRHIDELSAAGKGLYFELKNIIAWVKDAAGMGSFYRSRHEFIFVYKNGTAPHINAFELGQHGRSRSNVWQYRGITTPTREARDELAMHPTVKPVAMVADALKDCSQRGGIVLDPFCGSGTILIAAQKTGRRARAAELDPGYCDTAIRRWQAFAKDDAVLISTGETFDQVQQRRQAAAEDEAAATAATPSAA